MHFFGKTEISINSISLRRAEDRRVSALKKVEGKLMNSTLPLSHSANFDDATDSCAAMRSVDFPAASATAQHERAGQRRFDSEFTEKRRNGVRRTESDPAQGLAEASRDGL